jgi:hypothetical protein
LPYNQYFGLLANRLRTCYVVCVKQASLLPNFPDFSISRSKDL